MVETSMNIWSLILGRVFQVTRRLKSGEPKGCSPSSFETDLVRLWRLWSLFLSRTETSEAGIRKRSMPLQHVEKVNLTLAKPQLLRKAAEAISQSSRFFTWRRLNFQKQQNPRRQEPPEDSVSSWESVIIYNQRSSPSMFLTRNDPQSEQIKALSLSPPGLTSFRSLRPGHEFPGLRQLRSAGDRKWLPTFYPEPLLRWPIRGLRKKLYLSRYQDLQSSRERVRIMEIKGALVLSFACLCALAGAREQRLELLRRLGDLLAPGERVLSGDALGTVIERLENRVQCSGVSCGKVEDFFTLAPALCLFLSDPLETCRAIRGGAWASESEKLIRSIISPHNKHGDSQEMQGLEKLFEGLEKHYQPETLEGETCLFVNLFQSCFSVKDVLEESGVGQDLTRSELDVVFGNILYHALRGDCMKTEDLPEPGFFLDYIFSRFTSNNLTLHDFEDLLVKLNLGGEAPDHEHLQEPQNLRGAPQRNISWDSACFSAAELWRIYRFNSSLTQDQFTQISPALLQQILSGGCSEISPDPITPDTLSTAERYGYATLANLVICLMALLGVSVLLFSRCTQMFQLCIQFCISLAVGSLTGDALLHLLPAFLGLHVHEQGHDHSQQSFTYVYKLLVLIGGIYIFYLMEGIFSIITRPEHHHEEDGSDVHHCDHGKVLQMYQREKQSKHSNSQADLVRKAIPPVNVLALVIAEKNEKSFLEPAVPKREQRLLPYMITIGDGIHNFADGLALGAAFSISWRSGLATSLAVLCHELPHELGDFAILLHCGVSVKRALLLNVGSSLSSFVGLYIALSVSTDSVAEEWISAVTAGLFLYVGLADMLPSLVHVDSKQPWLVFLLQNLGLLSGWAILLLLCLYEDQIGV
ncbi:hypothetical protein DNTS_009374 [Danionella cerebrum]|uniref:Zinc transporter ZIP4 n=1 Tax=Danionella cerebrum TaxID=2873325 RepID=A0A553PX59_9TELE|nr:hypothetical protein DNTS_009374 [Danionella translucida]